MHGLPRGRSYTGGLLQQGSLETTQSHDTPQGTGPGSGKLKYLLHIVSIGIHLHDQVSDEWAYEICYFIRRRHLLLTK